MHKAAKSPPRTKDIIAQDVAYLNAPLHDKTKRIVVKNAAWAWTTMSGKYEGCRHWTQAALDHFNAATGPRKAKGLNHEHVVPIAALFQILQNLAKPTTQEIVQQCLEKYLQGVIVTRGEHDKLNEQYKKTMPDGFDFGLHSIYARYEKCGIKIVEQDAKLPCRPNLTIASR